MDQVIITSNATVSSSALGAACCLALSALLPSGIVSLPGSTSYDASQLSYFSAQQREVSPACIVSPSTTDEVATVIKTITSSVSTNEGDYGKPGCPFAVRSGGHSSVPGSVNSDSGVTIDLRAFNQIQLNEDKSVVSIGVGNRWGQVYSFLEEHGLSVTGGRVASVGVGGLVLGGGISYFSPRHGWACDTAVGFEVVLADGSIVHVTEESDKELLVALRGGSGNFGVVTRIDMRTFEQTPFRGGISYHDTSKVDEHIKFLDRFVSTTDEYASMMMSFAYAPSVGPILVSATVYTKNEENPKIYEDFDKLPAWQHTRRIDTMSSFAEEMGKNTPDGDRQFWIKTTFKSTLPMLNATYLHWKDQLDKVESIATLGAWSLTLHPFVPSMYKNPQSTGNSLGFGDKDGPYICALLTVSYADGAADEVVQQAAQALMDAIKGEARQKELHDPYVYLNYANKAQDPLAGYGRESLERLRKVKARVDPDGVFSNWASGFKLPLEE